MAEISRFSLRRETAARWALSADHDGSSAETSCNVGHEPVQTEKDRHRQAPFGGPAQSPQTESQQAGSAPGPLLDPLDYDSHGLTVGQNETDRNGQCRERQPCADRLQQNLQGFIGLAKGW